MCGFVHSLTVVCFAVDAERLEATMNATNAGELTHTKKTKHENTDKSENESEDELPCVSDGEGMLPSSPPCMPDFSSIASEDGESTHTNNTLENENEIENESENEVNCARQSCQQTKIDELIDAKITAGCLPLGYGTLDLGVDGLFPCL